MRARPHTRGEEIQASVQWKKKHPPKNIKVKKTIMLTG
jgi:hypothetical protein